MSPSDAAPEPTTDAGREGLAALLREPGRALVAVDFDGTLAPIVADPAQARPHPQAVDLLATLARDVGRVAVVTGRPAGVAVELGGFAGVAGLEGLVVLGHYGLERWEAATGEVVAPPPHPGVDAVRRELPEVLGRYGPPDGATGEGAPGEGATIEDKGASLAVHTRQAADPAGLQERLRAPLGQLASRHGLTVEPGRMVLELRPPGVDKGGALRGLVEDLRPGCVVYAGDDLGDLAAFDAVDGFRADGLPCLLVCAGSEEVAALAARADLVVDGPDGLVDLLGRLVAELAG